MTPAALPGNGAARSTRASTRKLVERPQRERKRRVTPRFASGILACRRRGNLHFDKLRHETQRQGCRARFPLGHFVAAWRDRPISEITKFDVLDIINAKKRTAPGMARALLIMVKRFFNWTLDQHIYGLDHSPCDRMKRAKIIGELTPRSRRLTDAELLCVLACHRADAHTQSGAALSVVAAHWAAAQRIAPNCRGPEVDGDTIVIPAARMKWAKNGKAREHLVPLSSAAKDVDRIAAAPEERRVPVLIQGRNEAGCDSHTGKARP